MDIAQTVGWPLVAAGVADVIPGKLVVAPRAPEGRARAVVEVALYVGGLALAGLGVALLEGWLGPGGPAR